MAKTSHWIKMIIDILRFIKGILKFIWLVILVGLTVNIVSTFLISKSFDLKGTLLERITHDPVRIILFGFCFLLLTILVWVGCSFFEHNPLWFYNIGEKQRIRLRQRFAKSVAHEIDRISIQEDWKDYRFTELEAEVEAQGREKAPKAIALFNSLSGQPHNNLRREKSLSAALKKSSEKIILVEGEPGSGKSVALRHVALEMIELAEKLESVESLLPIYVNLKLLERKQGEKIDRDLIEGYIKSALMRSNDRDVQRFLDDEFHNGMRNGTLFFLLDSFDEIPEILNSTEIDDKVNEYGDAIDDFLNGMNQCRGVIASRFYRGPTRVRWTHFRILPLSEKRQLELISKTDLAPKARKIVGLLANANQTIRSMASNPFYLALLCKHLETGHPFLENIHVVFETYINQRFADDEKHIRKYFQLDPLHVRSYAEAIAFCMTASPNVGLSPTYTDLQNALTRLGLVTNSPLEKILDALEYMRLVRPDTKANTSLSKSFTFSHRRFQEYFATCFVLREPACVTPQELLTSPMWREAAVVLCQTQPADKLTSLLEQAERVLVQAIGTIPTGPLDLSGIDSTQPVATFSFLWPPKLLHVLELLQDGLAGRLSDIPDHIRQSAGRVLVSATRRGILLDKKWALEVAGIVPSPVLEDLLKDAFSSESQWLREVAYRQAGRLGSTSPHITQGIYIALIELVASNRLYQQRNAIRTHLARLQQPGSFLAILNLLLWLPSIDSVFHIILWFLFLFELFSIKSPWSGSIQFFLLLIGAISLFSSHMIFRIRKALLPEQDIVLFIIAVRTLLMFAPFCSLSFYRPFLPPVYPLPFDLLNWAQSFLLQSFRFNPLVLCFCIYIAILAPSIFIIIKNKGIKESSKISLSLVSLFFYPITFIIGSMIFVSLVGVILLAIDASVNPMRSISKEFIALGVLFLMPGILILISSIMCITSFVKYFHRYLHDRQKFQHWQNVDLKSITSRELIDGVKSYYLKTFCIKFIKVIRKQKIPVILLPETEVLLTQVILDIEKAKRINKQEAVNIWILTKNTVYSMIYTPTDNHKKFLAIADADVLDELNQWLENIQDQKPPTQ